MRPCRIRTYLQLFLFIIIISANPSAAQLSSCITTVPTVIGLSLHESRDVLTKNNLSNIKFTPESDPKGSKIQSQNPAAGSMVPCETEVTLSMPPSTGSSVSIKIKGIEDSGIYNRSITPEVNVSGPSSHVEYFLNDSSYDLSAISSEGSYKLKIKAHSSDGSVTERIVNFTIDKTPPVSSATPVGPQYLVKNNSFLGRNSTIELSAGDKPNGHSGVARIEFQFNNSSQWKIYKEHISLDSFNDGMHSLYFRAFDLAGNTDSLNKYSFNLDTKSPSSKLDIGSPMFKAPDPVIYVTDTTPFSISAIDEGSGVARIEYRINDGDWRIWGEYFRVEGEGRYKVEYRAIDNIGNLEPTETVVIVNDSTPPITTITTDEGQEPDSADAVFINKSKVFVLNAADTLTGISLTEYRFDKGNWQPYSTPFTLKDDSPHQIFFRSKDKLENQELTKKISVAIDKTAPITNISIGSPHITTTKGKHLVSVNSFFTLVASDTQSGVTRTEYRVDNGDWLPYSPFTIQQSGAHTIEFRSVDKAGNMESPKVLDVMVITSPPSTTISIDRKLYESGSTVYSSSENVKIALTTTEHGATIQSTEFKLDGGPWTPFQPFSVFSEGEHLIEFRSKDKLDNLEPTRFAKLLIDRSPPSTSLVLGNANKDDQGRFLLYEDTVISLSAVDTLSGVASSEYRISGKSERQGSEPFRIITPGNYDIFYFSTDKIGNREKEKRTAVTIKTLSPSQAKVNKPSDMKQEKRNDPESQQNPDSDIPDSIRLSQKPADLSKESTTTAQELSMTEDVSLQKTFFNEPDVAAEGESKKDRKKEYLIWGGINALVIAIIFMIL